MTETEYLWAWVAYFSGSMIAFAVFWWWTRAIAWSGLRRLLRLSLLVVIALPWAVQGHDQFMAPAWLVAGAETLLNGPQAFWRAGLALLLALALTAVISLCIDVIVWWRGRARAA